MNSNYEFCILDNENELKEYEKALFEAYSKKAPEDLKYFDIIDECRLRPKITYDKMIVYAGKYEGKIFTGTKICIDEKKYQFKDLGFDIPEEDKQKKHCEGINYFIVDNIFKPEIIYNFSEKFANDYLKDVKKKGFQIKYGTCIKRLKIIYLRMGYSFIGEKVIDNNLIYFTKYDFDKTQIRGI